MTTQKIRMAAFGGTQVPKRPLCLFANLFRKLKVQSRLMAGDFSTSTAYITPVRIFVDLDAVCEQIGVGVYQRS
jgi:hypothetical protein